MADLRKVEVCMAPSVVLSIPDSSTMGNIVEQTILHDYLQDTDFPPPHGFTPPAVTRTNWWDTGNQQHYKDLLLTRHPDLTMAKVLKLKTLKVPDISTWEGLFLRKGTAAGPAGKRNELYEVKPDSIWGEQKGREKIKGINDNFKELSLTGYKWGTWYPEPPGPGMVARKQIHFRHYEYVAAGLRYRIRRMERSLQAIGRTLHIDDVVLEIERRELGLLYYMICVRMTLDFNGEEKVAKKVVQRLFEAMTTGKTEQQAKLERQFADSLEPATRDRKPPVSRPPDQHTREAIRALETEAEFRIRPISIVDELRNTVTSLSQTLFSRLRGLPGERFIVCSDPVFYRNEIQGPRQQRMARQIALMQVRPPLIMGSRLALAGALERVERPIVATVYVILKVAEDPTALFTAQEEWQKAMDWLKAHPAVTLVVGSTLVYGTALIIASGGAAGAAGLYAGGAVATVEGSTVQVGSGLARALGGETLAKATLPAVERQVVERFSAETARRIAAQEADQILQERLAKLAQQEAARALARQAALQAEQEAAQKAFTAGGNPVAALALRMAIPATADGKPDASGATAPKPVAFEIGSLFLLPLSANVTDDKLPLLEDPFDFNKFSHESPGPVLGLPQSMGGTPIPKKLHYLGLLACD